MNKAKGCKNKECMAYKTRRKFNNNDNFCPVCGEPITYVCPECWEPRDKDEKYCEGCASRIAEKKASDKAALNQKIQKIKVGVEVAAPVVLEYKDELIEIGRKGLKMIAKSKHNKPTLA